MRLLFVHKKGTGRDGERKNRHLRQERENTGTEKKEGPRWKPSRSCWERKTTAGFTTETRKEEPLVVKRGTIRGKKTKMTHRDEGLLEGGEKRVLLSRERTERAELGASTTGNKTTWLLSRFGHGEEGKKKIKEKEVRKRKKKKCVEKLEKSSTERRETG